MNHDQNTLSSNNGKIADAAAAIILRKIANNGPDDEAWKRKWKLFQRKHVQVAVVQKKQNVAIYRVFKTYFNFVAFWSLFRYAGFF